MAKRLGACKLIVAILFLSLTTAGCGKGNTGPSRHKVSGTIMFKGKPLDQGSIQFVTSGSGSGSGGGAVIKDGKYEIPEAKGLPEGKYKVIISSGDAAQSAGDALPGESGPLAKERIPAEYNSQPKHTVEVTADGPNEFNFDIK